MSQVFHVYVLVHGLRFCVRGVIIVLLYPAYECVACFGLSNRMNGNMNTMILRLHPTRGSPNNVCLVANAWYNCSTRSDTRSDFVVSPREKPSGENRPVLYHFGPAGHESGFPAGSCKFAKRRIRGPNPRVRPAGQPKTTRGSW